MPVIATSKDGTFWERGSVDLLDASPSPQLGISAPGKDIMEAKKGGGYAAHDGTSAAEPIAAGTLALIKSAYPDLIGGAIIRNRPLDAGEQPKLLKKLSPMPVPTAYFKIEGQDERRKWRRLGGCARAPSASFKGMASEDGRGVLRRCQISRCNT